MWANFKTNCFRTRFTFIWNKISYFIWNKIVLLYIKQYLSNSFAPTVPASVIRSPYEIRTHYYKLPFVGPFSTYAQHRIKCLTQRCFKNLVIKLVFAPYALRRKAERTWRRTRSVSDLNIFKSYRNRVTYLMNQARQAFYTNFIDENSTDHKRLFRATKQLFAKKEEFSFPNYQDKSN